MLNILKKWFIPNYQQVNDKNVRERYGIVLSVFCIICNLLLVIFKLFISFMTNSIAIRADGLNNFSDMGSNLASLLGFKLAGKHPDSEHPYGHGRVEYIFGLFIGILITLMGISSLVSSIKNIVTKQTISFSYAAVIVVIISILVKMEMGISNMKASKLISSETLLATAKDSFNDVLLTSCTLVSLIIFGLTGLNIDAYVGVIVNMFVIKSGIDIITDLASIIIGKAPDLDLIKEIKEYILSYKEVLGIHEITYHDYGPGSRFMTLHCEVDYRGDMVSLHDKIDTIEKYILGKYNILTTIHMDPIVTDDPILNEYKKEIEEIVKDMNPEYSIHDFRMVKGTTHTNLVFDLVLPLNETKDHSLIRKELMKRVKEKDQNLFVSVHIEHAYI